MCRNFGGFRTSKPERTPPAQADLWLATVKPTRRQRQLTYGLTALVFAVYAAVAPFASVPLPRVDSFTPTVEGILSIAELVTAVFLFSQFSIGKSRALLVLACGYLYSALVVIPHALTFPRATGTLDLLSAGDQSAGWLYTFWHFGFLVAVIAYVLLRTSAAGDSIVRQRTRTMILGSVSTVCGLVIALTWFVITGNEQLPRLLLNDSELTPLAHYVTAFNLLVGVAAFFLLSRRGKSVLDLWLMVAVAALIAELAIVALFLEARFNFGFYFSRVFAIVSALAVLTALLAELANLYGGLSRTVAKLRLERESKLLSLETLIGAAAHEVKQPLTAIALEGNTALRLLKAANPDLEEVRSGLQTIVADAFRGAEMLRNIRDLLTATDQNVQALNINDVVLEALHVVDGDLRDHAVMTQTQLTPDLPWITAHRGQMLQVLINLCNNAIEAMAPVPTNRILRVTSEPRGKNKIIVTVEDTGPGLPAELADSIFDPLVKTEPLGRGLGLALCQTIVERHGGSIAVISEPGAGARFQITLPTEQY